MDSLALHTNSNQRYEHLKGGVLNEHSTHINKRPITNKYRQTISLGQAKKYSPWLNDDLSGLLGQPFALDKELLTRYKFSMDTLGDTSFEKFIDGVANGTLKMPSHANMGNPDIVDSIKEIANLMPNRASPFMKALLTSFHYKVMNKPTPENIIKVINRKLTTSSLQTLFIEELTGSSLFRRYLEATCYNTYTGVKYEAWLRPWAKMLLREGKVVAESGHYSIDGINGADARFIQCQCCGRSCRSVYRDIIPTDEEEEYGFDELQNTFIVDVTDLLCPYCGMDLCITSIDSANPQAEPWLQTITERKHAGNQLNELGLLGYLSGIAVNADNMARSVINNHDNRIVKLFLDRQRLDVVLVPAGLSAGTLGRLNSRFPQYIYSERPAWATVCSELRAAVISNIMNLSRKETQGQTLLIGRNFNQEAESWPNKIINSFSGLSAKHKSIIIDLTTVGLNEEQFAISIESARNALHVITVDSTNGVNFVNNGTGFEGTLEWLVSGNQFILNMADSSTPIQVYSPLQEAITTYNYITLNSRMYAIFRTRPYPGIVSITIVRASASEEVYKEVQLTSPNKVKDFTYPMISNSAFTHISGLPVMTVERSPINAELLKTLLTRNMTGMAALNDTMTYGVGFAHARYSLEDRTISHFNITPTQVATTSYLAAVLASRAVAKRRAIADIVKADPSSNQLSSLAVSTITTAIDWVVKNQLKDSIKPINDVLDSIDNASPGIYSEFANHAVWDELEDWLSKTTFTKAKIYKITQANSVELLICPHQPGEIDPQCACCGDGMDNQTCEHCTVVCTHQCTHKCNGHGNPGLATITCPCCGVASAPAGCPSCLDHVIEDMVESSKILDLELKARRRSGPGREDNLKPKEATKKKQHGKESDKMEQGNEPEELEEETITDLERLVDKTNAEFASLVNMTAGHNLMNDSPEITNWNSQVTQIKNALIIKYIPYGTFIGHNDMFAVISIDENNKPKEYCGFDALYHYYPDQVSLKSMQIACHKQNMFDENDIAKYAMKTNLNIVILTDTSSTVVKSNITNEFVAIIHGSALEGYATDHWYTGRLSIMRFIDAPLCFESDTAVARLNKAAKSFSRGKINSANPLGFSKDEHIKFHLLLTRMSDNILSWVDKGLWPITTSKDVITKLRIGFSESSTDFDDLEKPGLVIEMKSWNEEILRMLVGSDENTYHSRRLNMPWNLPAQIQEDLTEQIVGEMRSCIINYLSLIYDESILDQNNKAIEWTECPLVRNQHDAVMIDVSETVIKTGDIIFVRMTGNDKPTPVQVTINRGRVVIGAMRGVMKKSVTIGVPKISAGSELRRLYALSNAETNGERITDLLLASEGILGVGGSGKSTEIAALMKPDDVTIAMSTVAINGVRRKVDESLHPNVMSVERWCLNPTKVDTLFIDECSQIRATTLACILSVTPNKLRLYGDTDQVGVLDTSKLPGTRSLLSLADLAPGLKHTKKTLRFGEPLSKELAKAVRNLEGNEEVVTNYRLINEPTIDYDTIIALINEENPDVVLTFYHSHRRFLQRKIKASTQIKTVSNPNDTNGMLLTTVHRYQGNDSPTVMVIQTRTSPQPGIESDRHYTLSAAFRAKTKLIWYTAGIYQEGTTLGEIVNGTGYAAGGLAAGLKNWLGLLPASIEPQVTNTSVRPINRAVFESTKSSYESQYNVSVNLKMVGEIDHVVIRKFGRPWVVFAVDRDINVTVVQDSFNLVTDENIKDMEKTLRQTSTMRPLEAEKTVHKPSTYVAERSTHNEQSYTYWRWLYLNCASILSSNTPYGILMTFGRCNIQAAGINDRLQSLTFSYKRKPFLTITTDSKSYAFTAYISTRWGGKSKAAQICDGLSLSIEALSNYTVSKSTWMDEVMACAPRHLNAITQLQKWLSKLSGFLPSWINYDIVAGGDWGTQVEKIANSLDHLKLPVFIPDSSYRSLMIPCVMTEIKGTRCPTFLINEHLRVIWDSSKPTPDPISGVIFEHPEDVPNLVATIINDWVGNKLLNYLIGNNHDNARAGNFEIEGLILPMSKHTADGDIVSSTLINRLGKLTMRSKRGEGLAMFLPKELFNMGSHIVRSQFPKIAINRSNYSCLDDHWMELAETTMMYALNESTADTTNMILTARPHIITQLSATNIRGLWVKTNHPVDDINTMSTYLCNEVTTTILSKHQRNQANSENNNEMNPDLISLVIDASKDGNSWFNGTTENVPLDQVVHMGVDCLKLPQDTINQFIQAVKCRELIVHIPKSKIDKDEFNTYIEFDSKNRVIIEAWPHYLVSNGTITFGGKLWKISSSFDRGLTTGFVLNHVVKNQHEWLYSPPSMLRNTYKVKIEVPSLTLDILQTTRVPILSSREVEVDSRLVRALGLRMVRGDADFTKMLIFGRIMLNSIYYTASDTKTQYDASNSEVLDTVLASYCIYGSLAKRLTGAFNIMGRKSYASDDKQNLLSTMLSATTEHIKSNGLAILNQVVLLTGLNLTTSEWMEIINRNTSNDETSFMNKLAKKHEYWKAKLINVRRPIYVINGYNGNKAPVITRRQLSMDKELPRGPDVIAKVFLGAVTSGTSFFKSSKPQSKHWKEPTNLEVSVNTTKNTGRSIMLMTIGSTGDVAPFVELANGLAEAGCQVSLIYPSGSKSSALLRKINSSVNQIPLEFEVNHHLELLSKTKEGLNFDIESTLREFTEQLNYKDLTIDKIPQSIDVVIGTAITPQGSSLAEYYGAHYLEINLMPWMVLSPFEKESSLWTRTLTNMQEPILKLAHLDGVNATRDNFGLKPMTPGDVVKRRFPRAYAIDENLIKVNSTQESTQVGYLTNRDNSAFHPRSAKSACITYGSMIEPWLVDHVLQTSRFLLEIGYEVTILAGSLVKIMSTDDRAQLIASGVRFVTGFINQHEEFQRHGIVFHHGGAGTTHEVLRSGAYSCITPVAFDQGFWAACAIKRAFGCTIKRSPSLDEVIDVTNKARIMSNKITHMEEFNPTVSINNVISWMNRETNTNIKILNTDGSSPKHSHHVYIDKPVPNHILALWDEVRPLYRDWMAGNVVWLDQPVSLGRPCCGAMTSWDWALGFCENTVITASTTFSRENPQLNYSIWEHTIEQPVLPFDTIRGPAGTATYPMHAHGLIPHETMGSWKEPEIYTLAGTKQVIDEQMWLADTAATVRPLRTDTYGRAPAPTGRCKFCGNVAWIYREFGCTNCYSCLRYLQQSPIMIDRVNRYNLKVEIGELASRRISSTDLVRNYSDDTRLSNLITENMNLGTYQLTLSVIPPTEYDPDDNGYCVRQTFYQALKSLPINLDNESARVIMSDVPIPKNALVTEIPGYAFLLNTNLLVITNSSKEAIFYLFDKTWPVITLHLTGLGAQWHCQLLMNPEPHHLMNDPELLFNSQDNVAGPVEVNCSKRERVSLQWNGMADDCANHRHIGKDDLSEIIKYIHESSMKVLGSGSALTSQQVMRWLDNFTSESDKELRNALSFDIPNAVGRLTGGNLRHVSSRGYDNRVITTRHYYGNILRVEQSPDSLLQNFRQGDLVTIISNSGILPGICYTRAGANYVILSESLPDAVSIALVIKTGASILTVNKPRAILTLPNKTSSVINIQTQNMIEDSNSGWAGVKICDRNASVCYMGDWDTRTHHNDRVRSYLNDKLNEEEFKVLNFPTNLDITKPLRLTIDKTNPFKFTVIDGINSLTLLGTTNPLNGRILSTITSSPTRNTSIGQYAHISIGMMELCDMLPRLNERFSVILKYNDNKHSIDNVKRPAMGIKAVLRSNKVRSVLHADDYQFLHDAMEDDTVVELHFLEHMTDHMNQRWWMKDDPIFLNGRLGLPKSLVVVDVQDAIWNESKQLETAETPADSDNSSQLAFDLSILRRHLLTGERIGDSADVKEAIRSCVSMISDDTPILIETLIEEFGMIGPIRWTRNMKSTGDFTPTQREGIMLLGTSGVALLDGKITLNRKLKAGGYLPSSEIDEHLQLNEKPDNLQQPNRVYWFDDAVQNRSMFTGGETWWKDTLKMNHKKEQSNQSNFRSDGLEALQIQGLKVKELGRMTDYNHNGSLKEVMAPVGRHFIPYIDSTTSEFELEEFVKPVITNLVMNIYDDTDLTSWNTKIAPKEGRLKSNELLNEIRISDKTLMTEYPEMSKPVLHRGPNQTFNAVSTRLHSVIHYRKYKLNIQEEWDRWTKVYFKPGYQSILESMQSSENIIKLDTKATLDWIKGRPGEIAIDSELVRLLEEGMALHPMNSAKVHNKLESLLKEDVVEQPMTQQRIRIIVWHAKGTSAIFAPVFAEIKKRLKMLFNSKIVYADGYRPDELSARLRVIPADTWKTGIDGAKQDRQWDRDDLKFEEHVYRMLGLDPALLSLWMASHHDWKYKGNNVSGLRDAMRWSGQVTTSLGNFIANLTWNSRTMESNFDKILIMLGLGDDNLIISKEQLNTGEIKTTSKDYYNIGVTVDQSKDVGVFLQLLAHGNESNFLSISPDIRRLRMRYEVTNGVSSATDSNLIARTMSYCMMLGDIKPVRDLCTAEGWDLPLVSYYSLEGALHAGAARHKVEYEEVRNDLNLLINYMTMRETRVVSFEHLSERRNLN
ncbi:polyprotein [Phomopsis vexans endornavirus 1]|nr:polyprotein [Phomopsis vexans endornavirus 1]